MLSYIHQFIFFLNRPEGSSRVPTQRSNTPLDPPLRKNSPPQKCSPSHPPSRSSVNSLSRPSPSHGKFSPSSKMSPHARSPIPSKSPNSTHCSAPGSMPLLNFDDNFGAGADKVSYMATFVCTRVSRIFLYPAVLF